MARGAKTFRDGSYYRHVIVGKRTVKQGECAAIWQANGKRKLIEGPRRKRLWFAHVRFLDRFVADQQQYLEIQYRDGNREHRRGPIAVFMDPCVHQSVQVKNAYMLGANEALCVYRASNPVDQLELDAVKITDELPAKKNGETGVTITSAANQTVLRRIVRGPAVFIPNADEWVHAFSWHGTPSEHERSSVAKLPNRLNFEKLRCTPDQMYTSVNDVRTSDDAQLTLNMMIFFELRDVEKMLDTTTDPIGDFINASAADVMTFAATRTYEALLRQTERLSELETFPILRDRMAQSGYVLHKVVYRGYATSKTLQDMHDRAIASRTKLRLDTDQAKGEQQQQAMELACRQERSEGEQLLKAKAAKQQLELDRLTAEQAREERDADHAQRLRHEEAVAHAQLRQLAARQEQELVHHSKLAELGVDMTRYLCALHERRPDQHLRIDGTSSPSVQLELKKLEA